MRVTSLSDLPPGRCHRVDTDNRILVLVRLGDEVFALDGICTHADGELYAGTVDVEAGCVVCPLHSARFNLRTGKVGDPPPVATDIQTFPVRIEGDDVFVDL